MGWPNDLDQSGANTNSILEREGPTLGNILNFVPSSVAAVFTTIADGLVPHPGSIANKFLRDDGTWQTPAGGGGGGTPGGTSGQIQYNNSGSFGGFTASGDVTINTSTGAVAVTKTNGVAFAASATTDTTNAANISSGTLPAGRMPALTGPVTTVAGAVATTIVAGAVTLAMMASLAANSVIGNNTGAPATPIALTQTQLTAMVNTFTNTLSGAVAGSGGGTTNFLRADGTWAAPGGSGSITIGTTTISGGAAGNMLYTDGSLLQATGGVTWVGTGQLVAALGSITTNLTALNITGTWNAVGTTFDAPLLMNITNTASAANSALFDIQQGGVRQLTLFNRVASTASPTLALGNSTTSTQPAAFFVYNLVDTLNNPTNYERLVFDWTTQGGNTAAIGTAKGGTGSSRSLFITTPGQIVDIGLATSGAAVGVRSNGMIILGAGVIGFQSNNNVFGNTVASGDVGIGRPAAKVLAVNDSQGNNANGWLQWTGQQRLDTDFSATSNTTLTNITGTSHNLSVTLQAGRKYAFEVALLMSTGASLGGIKIGLGGTATVTNLIADGICIDGTTEIAVTQVSTLTQMVANTNAGTTPKMRIWGVFEVNAAGTLTVQFAQNVSNGTASTVKRGSYMKVHDYA